MAMATMLDTERLRGLAAASQGTNGGGNVDDIQKRLGLVETAIAEIKVILRGLATRTELEQMRAAIGKELEQHRVVTNAESQKVHGDIREIKATLPHLATKADLEGVRRDVEVVRTEVTGVRGEISELKAAMIKWVVATMLATAALAFSIAKFVW
jgi:flagellar motility protein MotE (MotC chaperone)